jgi:dTMP kinase
MSKGFFLSFEGGEGAGKTTLIQKVADTLTKNNHQVLITREPGGTPLGEKIRTLLLDTEGPMTPQSELCLFLASRSEHLQQVILPALQKGTVVLCDRFNDSSIAYQGSGRDLGIPLVKNLCNTICNNINPDLTFYLDLSPKEAFKRLQSAHDRIESEEQSFHQKVRQGYLKLAKQEPDRIKILDATLSKEEVFENAKVHLRSLV